MITEKTKIELSPTTVVYRTPLCYTTAVVKVILTNPKNPRIMAYSEDISGQVPMSLFIDEIDFYIKDSKERLYL